jgi:hypothetical protein
VAARAFLEAILTPQESAGRWNEAEEPRSGAPTRAHGLPYPASGRSEFGWEVQPNSEPLIRSLA